MEHIILEMKGITKVYGNGIMANNQVDFSVREGEIHALMGENGAGKSTLMKMIFGIEHPDEGEIYCKGQKVNISSPIAALGLGIGMVHQHFMLVPSLTVAENMVLRCEPRKGIFINMEQAVKEAEAIAEKYNLQINAKAKVSDLA
ncbi:MAG: ATP-binding cassette domain-containing protein, partial [Hungatella sp.]